MLLSAMLIAIAGLSAPAAGASVSSPAAAVHDVGLAGVVARLQGEPIRGLYARTYKSLCDRVEPSGYFQESLTGAYQGMFPRTVGGLVSLFAETGEGARARRLVDVVLRATAANHMNRVPHVMGRPETLRIPVAGANSPVQPEHPIVLYRLDSEKGYGGAQSFVAPHTPLRAVEAWLAGDATTGVVRAKITVGRSAVHPLAEAEVPAASLKPTGSWVRFSFPKAPRLTPGRRYLLQIQAAGGGVPTWWGLNCANGNPLAGAYARDREHSPTGWLDHPDHATAFALDAGDLKHEEKTVYPIYAREDEVDGNFHVLLAWAIVAQTWPDRAWEDTTWPEVARLTDVATDWPYLTQMGAGHGISSIMVGLVHNFCLEHSRDGRFWDCWDILTQSFACEALRKLTQVADARGDCAHAARWRAAYEQIERAVKERLTWTVDGKRIYAAMRLPNGGAGTIFPGLSWLNLAPVAAQWQGVDPKMLHDTLDVLRQKAGFEWHGHKLVGCEWKTDGTVSRAVIGKQAGWEMVYALHERNYARICDLLDFIADANRTPLFGECFSLRPDGTMGESDPGNGEQCSWWCWAMAVVRKAVGLSPAP